MNSNKITWLDGLKYIGKDLKLKWAQHGGKICTVAGTAGLIISGSHACRTTYKHHAELEENGRRISKAKEIVDGEKKSTRVFRVAKEIAVCGVKSARHYIPDMVAGGLSAYGVHKGWGIEHSNYQKAAAVMGILAADFMNYRKNVIAEHGIDADRRYLTTKRENRKILEDTLSDGTKLESSESDENGEDQGILISIEPSALKIKYSKETTPWVWSESLLIRRNRLESITTALTTQLLNCGFVTVNDIRREFFGKAGDVPEGGLFGRVYDPGNPKHPERGGMINLHWEEDQDFYLGLKDWCWIIIDIDTEPMTELMKEIKNRDPLKFFTKVED